MKTVVVRVPEPIWLQAKVVAGIKSMKPAEVLREAVEDYAALVETVPTDQSGKP